MINKFVMYSRGRAGSNLYAGLIERYLDKKYPETFCRLRNYIQNEEVYGRYYTDINGYDREKYYSDVPMHVLEETDKRLSIRRKMVEKETPLITTQEARRRMQLLKKYSSNSIFIKAEHQHLFEESTLQILRDLGFKFLIMNRKSVFDQFLSIIISRQIKFHNSMTNQIYDDFLSVNSLNCNIKVFQEFTRSYIRYCLNIHTFIDFGCDVKIMNYEDIVSYDNIIDSLELVGITDYHFLKKKDLSGKLHTKLTTRDKIEYFSNSDEIIQWYNEWMNDAGIHFIGDRNEIAK